MALAVDITLTGDRELERKLGQLEAKMQKKFVRKVFRDHAKRVRTRVVGFLSGNPVGVRRGVYRSAMASAPIRAGKGRSRSRIVIGVQWPTRTELGIDAGGEGEGFYPAALEYGHGSVPAFPHMRPAIDNYKRLDVRRIGRALRREMQKARLL